MDQGHAVVTTIESSSDEHVAAVMFPADPAERAALAASLGHDWTALDGRKMNHAAAVFVRPCSVQTIAGIRRRFPAAHIVIVESSVPGRTHLVGPVQRLLQAGADQYRDEIGRRAA